MRPHRILWDLARSCENSPNLVRSRRIWRDLAGSSEISSVLPRHQLHLRRFCPILVYLLICCCCILLIFLLWWVFCCGDVCCCLVEVIFYLFVVVMAKILETRPTCLPKPINRSTWSDHLNGWSTGWSFANLTQDRKSVV